jgi:CRISPR-associated protein Csm2
MVALWKDKEKRIVDKNLYSKTAEEFALLLAQEQRNNNNLNRRSQIRKFYDEIVKLNNLTRQRPKDEWKNILPLIHILIAKAAYAEGRKLVSENFRIMIKDCINEIDIPDDLEVFTSFFESLMGFYRLYAPKNN